MWIMKYAVFVLLGFAAALPLTALARADSSAPPVVSLSAGTTSIDDIGWYSVSYRYADGRTGVERMGWTGDLSGDPATGIAALPQGMLKGKRAFLLQPIWRNGTGDTDQTFRLALPKSAAIDFSFSTALWADGAGKSDGVTFRVFVNGDKLLDQNKTDDTWSNFHFDLSRYAGQTITLVFESDPGPKGDSSFDFALWGTRQITCAGTAQKPLTPRFIPTPITPLDGKATGWGSASPTRFVKQSSPNIAAVVGASPLGLFNKLAFRLGGATQTALLPFANFASLDLVAPDGRIVSSDSPEVECRVTQSVLDKAATRRTAFYTLGGRTIKVTADIDCYDGSSVRLRLRSTEPYIAAVHFGRIGPTSFQRGIPVPYYGIVNYATHLGLFSNVMLDYGQSQASGQTTDSASALYDPLTNGRRLLVDETVYYAVSPHMQNVLPTPIGPVSPYRQTMGNLAVIDFWGASVLPMKDRLQEFSTYGLTRFLTIVHNWQHGGYDQQLPDVLPASDAAGGDAGVRALTSEAKTLGERVALHENYDDFYPNSPLYTTADVAVHSDGSPIPAWMFPGHVSNLLSPVLMQKYAVPITTQVHRDLGTNASYIDVLSAINPFAHTDARASRSGAGEFATTIREQRKLWQLMRDVHGGPVLGEGANHWYWSGMLDGVEAQFGVGIPQSQAQEAPLLVDFDLLKIHPRQINHGMGYYDRWLEKPDTLTPTDLDEYQMQEIAFGHSAFVGDPLGKTGLPTAWDEDNLVVPVASRYATANVRSIAYEVNGALLDTDRAIAAGSDFSQVRVIYGNGLTLYANARAQPWHVRAGAARITLPKYGWAASGAGLLAYSAMSIGRCVSFARTANAIYANARTQIVADAGLQPAYAAPTTFDLKQIAPRAFQVRFAFHVSRAIPPGYKPFVHLVSDSIVADEGIAAQFSIGIDAAPSDWPVAGRETGSLVTATLPANLPDGTYELRVGLYNDSGRLPLNGLNDGSQRYRVARIVVSDGGNTITANPITVPPLNTAAIPLADFGVLATNGSVKLERRGPGDWVLIPLPRNHDFQVIFDGSAIDAAFKRVWATPIDAAGKPVGTIVALPLHNNRRILVVHLPTGAVAYRLTSGKAMTTAAAIALKCQIMPKS